jgi:hypothetical protein
MRSRAIFFGALLSLLTPLMCSAQSSKPRSLLARFTYTGESSRICFAVYQNGEFYRLSKTGLVLLNPDAQEGSQIIEGRLSEEQLSQLTALLQKIDFRPQTWGGVVLNNADWFAAEVVQDHKTKHYKWLNADHRDPFPNSVLDLVNWLQNFKAQNSKLISSDELGGLDICPPVAVRPLQPVIAGLNSGSDAISCVRPRQLNSKAPH